MGRLRLPRQSAAASSGGTATSSTSDATTPGTTSGVLNVVTSTLASTTVLTSTSAVPSSSSTGILQSLTPSSQSSAVSSSAGTTSTPQSTSSSSQSSSSSSVSSTSSVMPSSSSSSSSSPSSSIHSSATSSTASSSSSIPSSSFTTTSPTPSSSNQGTPTTITSSYTTFVNGTLVATQTSFPTTIPVSITSTSNNRAAIIGGSAVGGTAFLILLLTLAFCARRNHFKRINFLDAITLRRKQIRSRATLLDGEDLAEVDPRRPHRYTDYDSPWDARDSRDGSDRALIPGRATPSTPRTLTGPSRWSENSSAFKEEIWPPPHEGTRLMDALADSHDPNLDLGRIVDDVMGPVPATVHFTDRSVSSVYRDSVGGSDGVSHSRTASNSSNAGLLDAAGLGMGGASASAVGSTSSALPIRSSPLAQPNKSDLAERQGREAP